MTMATTYIEVERPINWRGEKVDMSQYDGLLDYFEVEAEGSVNIWSDPNYGADADGNRGWGESGADVEDLTYTLYGDFRPFYIKWRDRIVLAYKNRWRIRPLTWQQLSDYDHIKLPESVFDKAEIDSVEESLISEAEEGIWDSCEFEFDGREL